MSDSPIEALSRQLRAPMLRFAHRMLPAGDLAEDLVQDTLLSLMESPEAWPRANDPRRYVFGILKNKIADALRRKHRHPVESLSESEDFDDLLFDENKGWLDQAMTGSWSTPETRLENDQFLRMVDLCVTQLPVKAARVFGMRIFLDFEATEVCATLGLSKADYWQCLSRARKQLQLCLDQRWFKGTAT